MAGHEAVATDSFDMTMTLVNGPASGVASRMLSKTFHGDLDATSLGQMLSAGDSATGAAGYVAMEQVTGTLAGRCGTFALQHSGTIEDDARRCRSALSRVPRTTDWRA